MDSESDQQEKEKQLQEKEKQLQEKEKQLTDTMGMLTYVFWIYAFFGLLSLVFLAVFVNPPFVTYGQADESSSSSFKDPIVEGTVIGLVCWTVIGGILTVSWKPRKTRASIALTVLLGVPIGCIVLTFFCLIQGHSAVPESVKSYYLGRGVGTWSLGWLLAILLMWAAFQNPQEKKGKMV